MSQIHREMLTENGYLPIHVVFWVLPRYKYTDKDLDLIVEQELEAAKHEIKQNIRKWFDDVSSP